MRSLRTWLVVSTAAGAAAVLAVAGFALYLLVRDGLVDQFDRAMNDKAGLLASAIEYEGGEVETDFDELAMDEFAAGPQPSYLQVWLPDGSVCYRSPSLAGGDLGRVAGVTGLETVEPVILPDGRPGRRIRLAFTPRVEGGGRQTGVSGAPASDGPRLVLVLSRPTARTDATLARLRAALIGVGAAAVAVTAAVLWVAVRRGLRPVDRLAGDIGAVNETALSRRIALADAPTELAPVVSCLNRLLGRLEAAFERERGFSADVAHELRTPLAGLRSTMDVTLARPRAPQEYKEALRACHRITVEMQTMVEHLLALARLDAGQMEVRPERVSPARVIRDAWQPLAERAEARGLHVAWRVEEDGDVLADAALLGLVVRNVLENVVVHADEGGDVIVETVVEDVGVRIRVTNTGSRLSQEQADRAFERFWRGDAARTQTGMHCGLGLPLVRMATEVMGGTVAARSMAGGEFAITVFFPIAARSD